MFDARYEKTSVAGGAARTLACLLLLFCAADARALEPGDAAPLFTAPKIDGGDTLSLADYRGKVVYLDFWASWCPPCLTSLPLIDELRKKFPAEDFQVLAINVDGDPDNGRKFLERHPIGYPSTVDPEGRIPKSFEIQTMPTSFLIDRRGVVRYVHDGFRRGDVGPLRERIAALVAGGKR